MRIVIVSLLIIAVVASGVMAQEIHVNDDNTQGPWDGSAENPYLTIMEGITAAGADGTILVAAGTYPEQVEMMSGQSLMGGYSEDFLVREWEVYSTVINPSEFFNMHCVLLHSGCRLDGFCIDAVSIMSSAAVIATNCEGFEIRNCRFIRAYAFADPYGLSSGFDIIGIQIEGCTAGALGAGVYNVVMDDVRASSGAMGEFHTDPDGRHGGDSTGIHIRTSEDVSVTGLTLTRIKAGSGGPCDSISGGNGGPGGYAKGIHVEYSSNIHVSSCFIQDVRSGFGGWGMDWDSNGGDAGSACGIEILQSESMVSDLYLNYIVGGSGGTCIEGSSGGPGGECIGIRSHGSSVFELRNSLISGLYSGTGGVGPVQGGNGGTAVGIQLTETVDPIVQFVTIDSCRAGSGGNTELGTGSNGAGGDGVAKDMNDVPGDAMACNIFTSISGGQPGNAPGTAGASIGVRGTAAQTLIMHDVFGCDENYSGCVPGDGSFSLNPLYQELPGYSHCLLSQTAAGQPTDSPCMDAGNIPALAIYPTGEYSTRTDLVADTDFVDFGYHTNSTADPMPTRPPSPTPEPTRTPAPAGTGTAAVNCNGNEAGEFTLTQSPDYRSILLPPCSCMDFEILNFIWPETDQTAAGILLWGAALNADTSNILGSYCHVQFGFSH